MNYQPSSIPPAGQTPTVITDIDIPFGRLVMILVKFALAAIPAYLMLLAIFLVIFLIFGTVFGGLAAVLQHH